jgi:hypothetical protein
MHWIRINDYAIRTPDHPYTISRARVPGPDGTLGDVYAAWYGGPLVKYGPQPVAIGYYPGPDGARLARECCADHARPAA